MAEPLKAVAVELGDDDVALRIPAEGEAEITAGCQVLVRDGQAAVLIGNGAVLGVYDAGRHSIPQGAPGFFYFVNRRPFALRWGTPEPIQVKEGEVVVPVKMNGEFSFQVLQPGTFGPQVVGGMGKVTLREMQAWIRQQAIVPMASQELANTGSFTKAVAEREGISERIRTQLASVLPNYGVALNGFSIAAIDTNEDARVALKAAEIKAAGPSGEKKREFPCKQCGADVLFTPGAGLKCPFCGHTEKIAETGEQIEEFSFDHYLKFRHPAPVRTGGKDIKCKACGAETTVDASVSSMNCAFCGNPMVLEAVALPPQLQPEAVIPFRVSKDQCLDLFRTWVKSRWFAPNALKRLAATDRIVGVYRPYWTYDSHTSSWYVGERGDAYYVTESYTDSQGRRQTRQVRKIRWSHRSGHVAHFFDDVLVAAGKPLEWNTNYDMRELKPYDAAFLAGWSAERYSIPPETAWGSAKQVMDGHIYGLVKQDIGGDEQRVHSVRTSYNAVKFKHILLPIWLSAYFYRGKQFRFQINGQSGEVKGQRPYSFWKIFFLVLGIAAVIALLVWLGTRGGGSSTSKLDPRHQEETAQAQVDLEVVAGLVLEPQEHQLVPEADQDVVDRLERGLEDALDVRGTDVGVRAADADDFGLEPEPPGHLGDEAGADHGERALGFFALAEAERL